MLVLVNNEASQICILSWPWGFSLHYSWVLRLDPGNKLSEALCQYETLAATMGSASNYTVDRHHHKGAERGPPPFSHTPKNESVCCRSELCLYSIYSFCPRPLFSHQWGLKCWWKPGGTDFSLAASESSPSFDGLCACWTTPACAEDPPRVTEQRLIRLFVGKQRSELLYWTVPHSLSMPRRNYYTYKMTSNVTLRDDKSAVWSQHTTKIRLRLPYSVVLEWDWL